MLDRYMDVSTANQQRKLLICRERAEARDPEKVQESTFSATCWSNSSNQGRKLPSLPDHLVQEGQRYIHTIINTGVIIGKLLVLVNNIKRLQTPHQLPCTKDQFILIA